MNNQDEKFLITEVTALLSGMARGISDLAAQIACQTEAGATLPSQILQLSSSLDRLTTEVTKLRADLKRLETTGHQASSRRNERSERRFPDFRRRVERHPLVIEVNEIMGYPDSKSNILDINNLGVQLETDLALQLSQVVEFNLFFPEEKTLSTFIGEVVWIKEVSPEPPRYCAGINFLNPYRGLSRILYKKTRTDQQAVPNNRPSEPKKWWKRNRKSPGK